MAYLLPSLKAVKKVIVARRIGEQLILEPN